MVRPFDGQIAQSVEQRTENPCVAGSIPVLAILFHPLYCFLIFHLYILSRNLTLENVMIDPVIGQTRTKVGESYIRERRPRTSYYSSPYYHNTHYYPMRRRYTYLQPGFGSAIGGAVALTFVAICVLAALSSPYPSNGGYSHYSTGGMGSTWGDRVWKCDDIEYCDILASGRRFCNIVQENCHWVY